MPMTDPENNYQVVRQYALQLRQVWTLVDQLCKQGKLTRTDAEELRESLTDFYRDSGLDHYVNGDALTGSWTQMIADAKIMKPARAFLIDRLLEKCPDCAPQVAALDRDGRRGRS